MTDRPRVVVLFGGRSSEHAISCVTAGSVIAAIDPARYDVIPVGITTEGSWVLESGDPERLQIKAPDVLPQVDPTRAEVSLTSSGEQTSLVAHQAGDVPSVLGAVDVVFPAFWIE